MKTMRKFIAAFLFILVVPLAFAAIHYERQDFVGDTYFEQQIQAKRGIASSSSVSATTILSGNITSTGTVSAAGNITSTGTVSSAGVNIGGGGAIAMVKVASLDFLTSAAATVVPLAGVLPGDTIMAMPNSTATEPLISVVPSTGTLTFTWDGDNATTLTVGVIVLR